ncbi:MAG TPA: type II toxin-antitoxin system HicB family antitoxin [Candidatus Paceibacterota bacterium]
MKKRTESIYQYEVIFEPNGDGYTVTVPKLPGLVTEGNNLQESREMARDAIKCYLEALLKESNLDFSTGIKHKERVLVGV